MLGDVSNSPIFLMASLLLGFSLYTVMITAYAARKAVQMYIEDFDAGYAPGKRKRK